MPPPTVFLDAGASGRDDPDVQGSVGLNLTNDQARAFAVALYRAVEDRATAPAAEVEGE